MRTTLDLPDALLRQLKARAALDGTTLKALLLGLIERGLRAPAEEAPTYPSAPAGLPPRVLRGVRTHDKAPTYPPAPAGLPSIRLGSPLNLPRPSNAALFELLDD